MTQPSDTTTRLDPDPSVPNDIPSPTASPPTTNEPPTYSTIDAILDDFTKRERTARIAMIAKDAGLSIEQATEIQAQGDRSEAARHEVAQVLAAHLSAVAVGEARSREEGAVLSKAHRLLKKGHVRK